jgi:nitrite reductase/ring-hydroxylating ferredoxin subunit
MTWREVAKVVDVPEGEAIQVCIDGEPVALYNLDGTFHATHDVCTHALAHLSDGYIDGDCVECPLHAGVFHIPTGRPVSGPVQKAIRIYPVKVENEVVFIQGS